MVKREEMKSMNNDFGVVAVVLGVLSIIFTSINGIILGLVGLGFTFKQIKVMKNKWSKAGLILNVIGIVLGVIVMIWAVKYAAGILPGLQGA